MEELFSTLLYLIPMAFFIFMRLRGEKRKQEAARRTAAQKKTTGSGAVTPPKGRIVETGKSRGDRPAEPGDEEAARSEDGGAASLLEKLFQSGLYPGRTMTRETSPNGPPPVEAVLPPAAKKPPEERVRPAPATMPAVQAAGDLPAAPAAAAVPREKTPRPAGTGIFSAKLEKMPPLRRAVVMAEILGRPRGLKGPDAGVSD